MKKVSLAALLIALALNFHSADAFFERFSYPKGYQKGYDAGYDQAWLECWSNRTKNCSWVYHVPGFPDNPLLTMVAMYTCIGLVGYGFLSAYDYFILTPKNIIASADIIRSDLRELKSVTEKQTALETSYLLEYSSTPQLQNMSHFKNKFPRLNNRLETQLMQILHAIKSIVVQLQHNSIDNIAVLRHELYHLVNELHRALAQELPNNDLGAQIKIQLKLDDDTAQFLIA